MNKTLEQLKQEYKSTFNRLQELGAIIYSCADIDTNHCGKDAEEEANVPLNELLGMEVVAVGGIATNCEGCSFGCDNCVKVGLAGGDYICLNKPEQDFTDCKERPTISFDEEESNVMDDIKEKTEDFLNYLDDIINPNKQ